MKQQRETYEALRALAETMAGPTNAMTVAGFLKIAADTEMDRGVRAALESASSLLQWYASLSDRAREALSQAPKHCNWPCEGCDKWSSLGCGIKGFGGFWG